MPLERLKKNQYLLFIVSLLWCPCSFAKSCLIFATPWTAAHQASLSFTISQNLLKFKSIESVMPSHSLLPPSPPAFSLSQHQGLFQCVDSASGGQSIGASASVLPKNIQDWFPLELTGLDLIFLLSNRLSRIFFSTTVWKHHFFSLLYGPALTSIHSYWKTKTKT